MPDRISKSNAQKSENAVASLPGSPVKSAVSPAISSPASGPAVSATTAKPRNANSETPTQARTARADSGVALEVAEAAASANRAVPDLAALTLHDAPAEQLTMTRAQLVEPSDENVGTLFRRICVTHDPLTIDIDSDYILSRFSSSESQRASESASWNSELMVIRYRAGFN